MQIHTMTLSNGLTLLVEELPYTHSVSIGCFVRVGSAHEMASEAGISHFIEHMLFKGSTHYPSPKQISLAVEGVGGMIDAYTDLESTVYYAKVADRHVHRAIAVLGDMLTQPLFDPHEVEKERRVIIEELHQTLDTPSEFVHTLLDTVLWGEQALGRDIAGDEASVSALQVDHLRSFWKKHYNAANMIISVAGNIKADLVAKAVEEAFRFLPAGEAAIPIASLPARPGPLVILESDDSEQANFCIGLPGLSRNDPDRRAMLILDTILGGGMGSRLVQAIREERGLAYNVGSEHHEHFDSGSWLIYASVEPERLFETVDATMSELRTLLAEGVSAEELNQTKEQITGGMLLALEDTWSVAARNGSHQLRYGRVIPIEQVVAEVEAVTTPDIQRVAQRVIQEQQIHLAVIGPYDPIEERTLTKQLRLV